MSRGPTALASDLTELMEGTVRQTHVVPLCAEDAAADDTVSAVVATIVAAGWLRPISS